MRWFTGKERDAETASSATQANDYFGARYYSSSQGRFTSPDWSAKPQPVPYANLSDPQTLNLYAYVRNNPLSVVDLDGHDSCSGPNAAQCRAIRDALSKGGSIQSGKPAFGQAKGSSNTITVTLNSRRANIPGGQLLHDVGVNHDWISTPKRRFSGNGHCAWRAAIRLPGSGDASR